MTLYTDKNNRYPAPAPTRIRLSDGTTMTSLTDTQLELFGFFPVPDKPEIIGHARNKNYEWRASRILLEDGSIALSEEIEGHKEHLQIEEKTWDWHLDYIHPYQLKQDNFTQANDERFIVEKCIENYDRLIELNRITCTKAQLEQLINDLLNIHKQPNFPYEVDWPEIDGVRFSDPTIIEGI